MNVAAKAQVRPLARPCPASAPFWLPSFSLTAAFRTARCGDPAKMSLGLRETWRFFWSFSSLCFKSSFLPFLRNPTCEWESFRHGDPEVTVYHLVQGLFPDAQSGGFSSFGGPQSSGEPHTLDSCCSRSGVGLRAFILTDCPLMSMLLVQGLHFENCWSKLSHS